MKPILIISLLLTFPIAQPPCSPKPNKAPDPEFISVERLHGTPVPIPLSELHRITPLGWAMTLDLHPTHRNAELFNQACQNNPKLLDEVSHLYQIKQRVEHKTKHQRTRIRW
jgi:hypothetical protein